MDDVRSVFLSRIQHCRKEDAHECALIGARMSWLVGTQAAFMISFFIVALNADKVFVLYNSLLLSFIAVVFAYTITNAVRKAEVMIYEWHLREKQIYKEINELKDNDLVKELSGYFLAHLWEVSDKEDRKSSEAFSFRKILFPALATFWTAVMLFRIYDFVQYKINSLPMAVYH